MVGKRLCQIKVPRLDAYCAGDRASSRADKLRKRLGWEAGILNGDGGKPKGMHWKTYLRIKSHHDALVQVSFHDIGRKLGFLHKLLDG